MKTNLEKLKEELCTVPEIKEDIMELRFWTKVEWEWEVLIYTWKNWKPSMNWNHEMIFFRWKYLQTILKNNIKNLWNPIGEHHLRMYFEEIAIGTEIRWDGTFQAYTGHIITKLDNKKSFSKQSEETLGKILEYLTTNK